jgi:hypothetical protein
VKYEQSSRLEFPVQSSQFPVKTFKLGTGNWELKGSFNWELETGNWELKGEE